MKVLITLALVSELIQLSFWEEIDQLSNLKEEEKSEFFKENPGLVIVCILSLIYMITLIVGLVNLQWHALALVVVSVIVLVMRKAHVKKSLFIAATDTIICMGILAHWLFRV